MSIILINYTERGTKERINSSRTLGPAAQVHLKALTSGCWPQRNANCSPIQAPLCTTIASIKLLNTLYWTHLLTFQRQANGLEMFRGVVSSGNTEGWESMVMTYCPPHANPWHRLPQVLSSPRYQLLTSKFAEVVLKGCDGCEACPLSDKHRAEASSLTNGTFSLQSTCGRHRRHSKTTRTPCSCSFNSWMFCCDSASHPFRKTRFRVGCWAAFLRS